MVGATGLCPSYSLVTGVFWGFWGLQLAPRRVVHGASWPGGRPQGHAGGAQAGPDRPLAHPQEKAHVKDRQSLDLVRSRESIAPSGASIRFGRLSRSREFAMAS